MLRILESGTIQTKLRVSQPGDEDEKEADRVAEQVVSAKHAQKIQRKCACGGTCAECQQEEAGTIHRSVASTLLRTSELGIQRAPATDTPASDIPAKTDDPAKTSPTASKGHSFIVDDDAKKIEPHQMRKSQFVALLRTDACATADAVLASVGHSTKSCPYIEKWLGFYEKQSAEHIAGAIRKYAPETATARSAHEVIRLVVMRIQRAALTWAKTGKLEGVPKELASQIPGQGGLLEKVHNFASTGVAGAIFGFIGGKKPEDSGSEKVSRKATGAEAAPAHDAASVKSQLGTGHSLDSRVQSQMSSAFEHDFSGVRVHTDSGAARLSSDLQARAFTIGSDVAFASGEYKPGTLIGDALIAHELAHVVQQSGASAVSGPMMKGKDEYDALEQDADRSAVAAVASLWAGRRNGSSQQIAKARPLIASGLRLSRCKKDTPKDAGTVPSLAHTTTLGPSGLACGSFEWGTIFSVQNAIASNNGFIVQKIVFDLKRQHCAGGHDDFSKTYWEAWQVRNGIAYIGTSNSRHDSDGVGDKFQVPSTPDEKGHNSIDGRAKYIEGYTAPLAWGNVPEAGSLPSTTSPPGDWSDAGTYHRKIQNDFDCCNGKTESNMTHDES